jgi:HK97 family phage major capsid protein
LAEEVTVANLIAEVGALQASDPNALDGAEWFFNPTVWALIRNLQGNVSDGAGGTIASGLPLVNIDKEWNYNLLGFPVNISAQAAATETVELAWGYFGNPRYIYVGDMMSMSVESSKDSRFSYDQTEFLARQRLAIAVGVPASLGVLKFGATP